MYKRGISLPIAKRSFFLFGPRQTGKSTLIHDLLQGKPHVVIDLLERDTFLKYKSHPEQLRKEVEALDFKGEPFTVFIDEVQKVPELLDEVHALIERYKGKLFFIMTGSSARKLRRSSANLLAGRAWQSFLHPLTHRELGKDFNLNHTLSYGSLPPIVTEKGEDAARTLNAYAQTYLKEEIVDEALTRNIGAFSKFLEIAADQSGQTVNYSNIARETHVSVKTVQGYYQILEDTLVASRLPPYLKSARKRLVLHPKYYLFDTGVIQSLMGLAGQKVSEGTSWYGRLFEHFVILEALRLSSYANNNWRFYHWRTSGGAEVDLIVETPRKLWAVEIKTSNRIEQSNLQGLRSFLEDYPKAQAVCVSPTSRAYRAGAFTVVPWQELFGPGYLELG